MTSTTVRGAHGPGEIKITHARVANSEWIKLRSLRSTLVMLAVSVIFMVGIGLLACFLARLHLSSGHHRSLPASPATLSLYGADLAQLTIGVLGALLITGEYATGMIRATLTAVPRRLPVLWAKFGVFNAVTLVISEVTALITFLAGQALLAPYGAGTSLSDSGVLRAVTGTGLYLAGIATIGMALGFIIRNTAGAITTLFVIVLALPLVGDVLPSTGWASHITSYLPSNAGQAVMNVHPAPPELAPLAGLAVFAAYLAAAIAAAAILLRRRDA